MGKCNSWGHIVIEYHRVFPLQFAGVAFCKSPKRDHLVGKLKCRGKFLHCHHCTHLSVLSCLLPETREKYKWARWRAEYKMCLEAVQSQLKDWYTRERNHEFCGRNIQSWRGIMVLYLVSCSSNSTTFIMETSRR